MAKVLVTEGSLEDIGDALREKLETGATYLPGEMAAAVRSIPTGGAENVIEGITLNGTAVPPDADKVVALVESDPTVPAWAKAANKPTYTASEVGAASASEVAVLQSAVADKVDKVSGKGLSTEDFTAAEKEKLQGIAAGAQVNSITGVKGDAEASYRTGNVNITAANIGLGNVNNTSDADKPVSTAVQAALNGKLDASQKGAANGVAELDGSGKVPSSQLPAYVDDVLEYAQRSAFPAAGESGKIYVDMATNLTYRWSGSAYVEISPSLALGETSATAYRGDRGKAAYDHAAAKGSAFTSGLYKITTNAEGHVTAVTPVTKADITALGIPGSDTDNNTTYTITQDASDGHKFTLTGSDGSSKTVTIPDNNTWRSVSDAVNSTSSDVAASSKAVKTAYDLAAGKTSNTGTVTKVSTGAGLTGGDITTTGTVKANLTSDDKLTNAAADGTETAGRVYPVRLDKNGKLAVNVPWNNTTALTSMTGTLGIDHGGTGQTTATNALNALAYLGTNPTGGTANDTRAWWQAKGTGYAYFNAASQLNGQPNQYGFLINLVSGSEVHQEFWIQNNGAHYHRGGNGSTSAMPSWTANDTNTQTITGVKGNAESSYRTGNVNITAANIGLGNVNNTSDADKPVSTAVQAALNLKVDSVSGKGLSTNDFTDAYKAQLDALNATIQSLTSRIQTLEAKNYILYDA